MSIQNCHSVFIKQRILNGMLYADYFMRINLFMSEKYFLHRAATVITTLSVPGILCFHISSSIEVLCIATCTKRGEKSFSAIGTFLSSLFFLMSRLSFQSVTMATAAIHVILFDHVLFFFIFCTNRSM